MAGVPVRVLVADNQQLEAAGTTAALASAGGFELVGVAASALAAAELAAAERPDLALVHARVPGGGDGAVRAILAASPHTRVLAHSTESDRDAVSAMLGAGAGGYVMRDVPVAALASALRDAAAGETVFNGVAGGGVLELLAIRLACDRAHGLPESMFLAVNVSPATAERPELLALLASCPVDHVVLEVTEHARVDDYKRFRVAIDRVRELGASLAVDDAGAGFASLRHILELDAELIKLDGSLTRSLETDPRRRSLASAVIEFGRESGASVLAEHIESELQLVELRRLGVHYGQGYHLGRPSPLPVAAL
jgi:DNA-binding NarL/FixJ family response regulator